MDSIRFFLFDWNFVVQYHGIHRNLHVLSHTFPSRRSSDLRGITTTHQVLAGLRALPDYAEIGIVFDATAAYAHKAHDEALRADGKLVVDLTPAAIGPF